jgi:hypothetical protein
MSTDRLGEMLHLLPQHNLKSRHIFHAQTWSVKDCKGVRRSSTDVWILILLRSLQGWSSRRFPKLA